MLPPFNIKKNELSKVCSFLKNLSKSTTMRKANKVDKAWVVKMPALSFDKNQGVNYIINQDERRNERIAPISILLFIWIILQRSVPFRLSGHCFEWISIDLKKNKGLKARHNR